MTPLAPPVPGAVRFARPADGRTCRVTAADFGGLAFVAPDVWECRLLDGKPGRVEGERSDFFSPWERKSRESVSAFPPVVAAD